MRRGNHDVTTGLSNAVQLRYERHHVGYMLGDVPADDGVEFVVREGIGDGAEIMNHVSVSFGIGVDADSARCFVPAATNVQNLSVLNLVHRGQTKFERKEVS